MSWKSQRTRALEFAMAQSQTVQQNTDETRTEIGALHRQLAELHTQLARRDVELIDAMARVATVTDQLRVQNEQDRDHHDRLDRAIELLTTLVSASSVGPDQPEVRSGPTVIGGSVDPSLLEQSPALNGDIIDLGGSESASRVVEVSETDRVSPLR